MIRLTLSIFALAVFAFTNNARAQDLSYLPDPVMMAATNCVSLVPNRTNKIINLCNKNVDNDNKIVEEEDKYTEKLDQISFKWNFKRESINTTYSNKVANIVANIAMLTARRLEILANCIGGFLGGEGDCTQKAAVLAVQIAKLGIKIEQTEDKRNIALAKNDTNREKQETKALFNKNKAINKINTKITKNDTKIDQYNGEIVSCNAAPVSCPS